MKTKKTININNFNELKNFILSNDLTKNQIEDIIFKTIRVFIIDFDNYKDKRELIKELECFIIEFPDIDKRPIFLDGLTD
jgi:hypothetical protein